MANTDDIELLHTTCANQVIPIENIDFIGELEIGQICDDNYKVHLKSGSIVNVSKARERDTLVQDRKNLVQKLTMYIQSKK